MGTIKVDTVTGLADPNKVSLSSGATLQVDEIVNVSGDKDSGINLATNDNIKFNIAGSQKAVIDSDGNLMVSKTSVAASSVGFEARANGFNAFTRDDGQPLEIRRLTGDGDLIDLRKDSTSIGSIGANGSRPYVAGPSKGIKFGNNSADPCTNSGGTADDSYDLGGSSIRWKDLYLSGGLLVGGTGSANKLDDYEEGTFTPTLSGSSSGSGTLSSVSARYTKVGRIVYCEFTFVVNSVGDISGNAIIGGFPFSSGFFGGQGAVRNQGFGGDNTDGIVFEMLQSTTTGRFHFNSSTSTQRTVGASDVSNGDFVAASICYST